MATLADADADPPPVLCHASEDAPDSGCSYHPLRCPGPAAVWTAQPGGGGAAGVPPASGRCGRTVGRRYRSTDSPALDALRGRICLEVSRVRAFRVGSGWGGGGSGSDVDRVGGDGGGRGSDDDAGLIAVRASLAELRSEVEAARDEGVGVMRMVLLHDERIAELGGGRWDDAGPDG